MSKLKRFLGGAATLAVPAAINARIHARAPRLESALDGERRYYPWDQGYVFYAVRGEGPPLVLVHGIYPGASSDEWRRVFVALAESHRVHALDLLGFGLSDRPRITYDPPLYEALLGDFLQDVVEAPAAVVATALTAAYAVHTAVQRPNAVSALALVGPGGLYDWETPPRAANFLLHRLLRTPVLGLSAYHALTSRRAFGGRVGDRLVHAPESLRADDRERLYTVAHQAGAAYALAAYVAGLLNESVEGVLDDVRQPVILLWGRHSALAPVGNAGGFLSLQPAADLEFFDGSGALPQLEEPAAFAQVVRDWLMRTAPTGTRAG